MRFACIGDIHGEVEKLQRVVQAAVADGIEQFIVVGDIGGNYLPRGQTPIFEMVYKYQASFQGTLKVLEPYAFLWVRGNHDAPEVQAPGGHCIDQRELEFNGLRFFGMGGAPSKFGWPNEWPDTPVRAAPGFVDILVTHCPPAGILSDCWGDDGGSHRVTSLVNAVRPDVHVFGHIHHQRGTFSDGRRLYVNAGALGRPDAAVGYTELAQAEDGTWSAAFCGVP